MDDSEKNHQMFSNNKGISLIETINYEYNEEKYILENQSVEDWKIELSKLKIGNFLSKGTRLCKIYKYTPS
jgi:hypothetical protein|uniref:Uncharacterized protein n=1 Tax=viral metagenome TaxID=1070528 RepID=A0A6C0CVK8_9ZZZZ